MTETDTRPPRPPPSDGSSLSRKSGSLRKSGSWRRRSSNRSNEASQKEKEDLIEMADSRWNFEIDTYLALTKLDDRLVNAIENQHIRIISSEWALKQPKNHKLQPRQELERLDIECRQSGEGLPPYLSSEDAVRLIRQGTRGIGVLTYGWNTPSHPDPTGFRWSIVMGALDAQKDVKGFFWDYGSLYQHTKEGFRTPEQQESFSCGIKVMGDLYASGIGTVIYQSTEMPPCPEELEGKMFLQNLREGAGEEEIMEEFAPFGVESCDMGVWPQAVLTFPTRESAEKAIEAARGSGMAICEGADHFFNNFPYEQRGWTSFEDCVGSEMSDRLEAYPKMKELLKELGPKKFLLWNEKPPEAVMKKPGENLGERLRLNKDRISHAKFTGKGDQILVPKMYENYTLKLTTAFQQTMGLLGGSGATKKRRSSFSFDSVQPDLPEGSPDEANRGPVRLAGGIALACSPNGPARRDGADGMTRCAFPTEPPGNAPWYPIFTTGSADPTHVESRMTRTQSVFAKRVMGRTQRDMHIAEQQGGTYDSFSQVVEPWHQFRRDGTTLPVLPEEEIKLTVKSLQEWRKRTSKPLAGVEREMKAPNQSVIFKALNAIEKCVRDDEPQQLVEIRDMVTAELRQLQTEIEHRQKDVLIKRAEMKAKYRHIVRKSLTDSIRMNRARASPIKRYSRYKNKRRHRRRSLVQMEEATQEFVNVEMRRVLDPHYTAVKYLRKNGLLGARQYLEGQRLMVRLEQAWYEAEVKVSTAGLMHELTLYEGRDQENTRTQTVELHPWNHAPLELQSFGMYRKWSEWYRNKLKAKYEFIEDGLSGKSLAVLGQCVGLSVSTQGSETASKHGLEKVSDVRGLATWLLSRYADLAVGQPTSNVPHGLLLTGPPASGKTTMLKQIVTLVLQDEVELVPIIVKVQLLQHDMNHNPTVFEKAWNWVDAYLSCEHGEGSMLRGVLRQALMARRAIVLFDGLDEGGHIVGATAKHLREVLVPQGHVVVGTSRPAGLQPEMFPAGSFAWLKLAPLTQEQQEDALSQRLGHERAQRLIPFCQRMPVDHESKDQVTSNPLMLSMTASVYELREGLEMPDTVAELYDVASSVMLSRGGVLNNGMLTQLLMMVFCQAQMVGDRVIQEWQVEAAALELIPADQGGGVENAWKKFENKVQRSVTKRYGKFNRGDTTTIRDRLKMENEERVKQHEDRVAAVREVYKRVAEGTEQGHAVQVLLDKVKQDRLPLLSLVQGQPFKVQASHLSYQEYLAARQICDGTVKFTPTTLPWKWTASWANVLKLGREIERYMAANEQGENRFRDGLIQASGQELNVDVKILDLAAELDDHHKQTGLTAVEYMIDGLQNLKEVNLKRNNLGDNEAIQLGEMLKKNPPLPELRLVFNAIGDTGAESLGHALADNSTLKKLNIRNNRIGMAGAKGFGKGLEKNSRLEVLGLGQNHVGDAGTQALALSLAKNITLKRLYLPENDLGPEGAQHLAELLEKNVALENIGLSGNHIGDAGAQALGRVLEKNRTLKKLDIGRNEISDKGVEGFAQMLESNSILQELNLGENEITKTAQKLIKKVKGNTEIILKAFNRHTDKGK